MQHAHNPRGEPKRFPDLLPNELPELQDPVGATWEYNPDSPEIRLSKHKGRKAGPDPAYWLKCG